MDGLWIVLVVAWVVFSFIAETVKKQRGGAGEDARQRARAAARERAERLARAGASPPARGVDLGTSPTQLEARRLEELLRGLGGALGMPDGPIVVTVPAPGKDEEEELVEAYSLEGVTLEGESRDVAPVRASREVRAEDASASALVQRRIDAAASRSGALGPSDHAAFHRRLATQSAPAQVERPKARRAAMAGTRKDLRRAVVWREILGPPVSLRDGDPV
jgi:hypothetical protein